MLLRRFNLSAIGSERDRVLIDACGSASKNIQIKRVVGAALALRWEKEKQVQEKKITYRKSDWSKRKVK